MLTLYIEAAMRQARYERLPGGRSYYGEIPRCRGVYASASTLARCRSVLAATLEDWVLLRVYKHLPLPKIDGIELKVKKESAA
jgi:predicted RNase H-like HicB family nuclease